MARQKRPGREVTSITEACPKSPKPVIDNPHQPLTTRSIRFNQTHLIALGLASLIVFSVSYVGLGYMFTLPMPQLGTFSGEIFGGPEEDRIESLFQLEDGECIAAGRTASWGLGGSPDAPFDFWLVRLRRHGKQVLWNHTYGTNRTEGTPALAVCSDGGFALAGYTLVNQSGSFDADVLLVRTDAAGHQLWSQTLGGPEGDYPEAIIQCDDDGFAIAGKTSSYGAGSSDAWLLKTDSTGTPEWNHTYGGPDADGASDLIETDSGFLLVGTTQNSTTTETHSDGYLVCTDTDGTLLWNCTYGERRNEFFDQIIATRSGDYVIRGGYGSGPYPGDTKLRDRLTLTGITANGDILWETGWMGLSAYGSPGFIECHDGGFAIVCSQFTRGHGFGDTNVILTRTDTQGESLWTNIYGGDGTDEGGTAILQMTDGDLIIVGYAVHTYPYPTNDMDACLLEVEDIPIMSYILYYSMHHNITQAFLVGMIISFTILIIFAVILAYHFRKRTPPQYPQTD